jgi:general secretion pathway protein B
MSFILDALKKSEAERRQGEVPRLQNDPFAPPPRRRPLWPLLLALALLLNGGVFAWWLLARDEAPATVALPADRSAQSAAGGPSTSAAPAGLPTPMAAESVTLPPEPAVAGAPVPATAGPSPALPAEPAVVTVVIEEAPVKAAAPAAHPAPAKTAESTPPPRRAQPAATAPARPRPAAAAPVAEAFPPVSELPGNVRSSLPALNLQLHLFTPAPERRLVRLNGLNLREGGSSGDGLNVVEITQDGVKLSYGGNRFFLPTGRP